MESLQELQGGDVVVIPRSIGGGSNPIAALNVEHGTAPPESSSGTPIMIRFHFFIYIYREREREREKEAVYLVVLIGLVSALIIQSLATNLGVSTGKHLSKFCKAEYPRMVKYCLWILAEISVIAADIPEVIGTAFGLNILFNIPVWVGVRKLEMLIVVLVFVMVGCFFREMSYIKPPASGVVNGMFVPKLNGQQATDDAIALLGALVMSHNIFLHSALVLSIKLPNSVRGVNDACRYFLIESGIALFVALLINVAIVSVFATNVLEKSSKALYAVALLASGQSSSITGTYTGQFIMQGFLNLHMKKWVRNIMTRCIAITPSLIMILSFELPFALISLLKFSSSSTKIMIDNYIFIALQVIAISWILGIGIIGINVYYLITSFVDWLVHNDVPKLGNVLIGIVVLPLTAIYIIAVIYLTCR
ncbi:hypothetical protein V6Z11_D06G219900 [Gossypium hirsutum]